MTWEASMIPTICHRDRSVAFWRCDESHRQRGPAGNWALEKQASREFTPIAWLWFVCKPREGAVSKAGTSNVALPTNANLAKVRLRTRLNLQPFQPRTTPLQPIKFQAQTHRRSGRVAPTLYGIRCSLTGHSETGSHSSDSTCARLFYQTACRKF